MLQVQLVAAKSCDIRQQTPRWAYLGKNAHVEAVLASRLPLDARIEIGARLQEKADRLRAPFVREIDRLGSLQPDRIGWYASLFAWMHPASSDLFLLACYRLLLLDLAAEYSAASCTIFIDDPWLFEDCRRDQSLVSRAVFVGRARLWARKVSLIARGIASRAAWAGRTARAWLRHRAVSWADLGKVEQPLCLLYGLPHARCFSEPGRWLDPFMPGLDAMLERNGFAVRRLVPTGEYGYFANLAERSELILPMISAASLWDVLASMAGWRARKLATFTLDGVAMPLIAERERWQDVGYARAPEYRFFYRCARGLFSRHRPRAIFCPWENQPWEKLLNVAAREARIRVVGCQHSVVPRFFLSYCHAPGGDTAFLPDLILAAGPRQRDALMAFGLEERRVRVGGSLRFGHRAQTSVTAAQRRPHPGPAKVLVVATHEQAMTAGTVEAVRGAFPRGGASDAISLHYRPHPTAPPEALRHVDGWDIVDGDLESRLPEFDVIVCPGSTVALEAAFLGIPVIQYRPSTQLDMMDLGNLVPEDVLEYATAAEMRGKILQAVRSCSPKPRLNGLRDQLFAPVDEQAWIGALSS